MRTLFVPNLPERDFWGERVWNELRTEGSIRGMEIVVEDIDYWGVSRQRFWEVVEVVERETERETGPADGKQGL